MGTLVLISHEIAKRDQLGLFRAYEGIDQLKESLVKACNGKDWLGNMT